MKWIVSANYRDRESADRWLVRLENQPTVDAVPCRRVICKGVRFVSSTAGEKGFGCALVAECESAEIVSPDGADLSPLPTTLQFNGWDFIAVDGEAIDVAVLEADTLHLFDTGKILAQGVK